MPTMLVAKLGAFLAAMLFVFSFGFYAGKRWEMPAVQRAQLALARQQTADAASAAKWNKQAADFRAQVADAQNAAQAARDAQRQAMGSASAAQEMALAHQAGLPGQDGPVAPVLQAEHANLAGAGP